MSAKHSKTQTPADSERRGTPSRLGTPSPLGILLSSLICLVIQEFGILIPLDVAHYQGITQLSEALTKLIVPMRFGAIPSVWLGVGCSVIVARAYGSANEETLAKSVHTAAGLALAVGFPSSIIATLAAQQSLSLFTDPLQLAADALGFWYLCCGATFLAVTYNMLLGIQRAVGSTWLSLICLLASAITTACLSVELLGALNMGIYGAAWALIGGQLMGCILCIALLTRSKHAHRLHLSRVRITQPQVSDMLECALPLVVQALAIAVFQVLYPVFVGSFGEDMLTAWNLVSWGELCLMTVAEGFAVATVTTVAHAFGAGSYDQMRQGPRRMLFAAIALVGILAVAGCLYVKQMAELVGLGEGISELASFIAPLTLPFSVLYALISVIGAAPRGAGVNVRPTVVTVLGCSLVPLIWLAVAVPRFHSIVTVALARPLSWGVTAALMLVYYRHGRWLTLAMRKARKQRNSRSRRQRRSRSNARHGA